MKATEACPKAAFDSLNLIWGCFIPGMQELFVYSDLGICSYILFELESHIQARRLI